MNKYDEAIEFLNERQSSNDGFLEVSAGEDIELDEFVKTEHRTYQIALEALREAQRREQGCEFCNNPNNRKLYGFPFCGECGRELEEII